jgi:lysophospholipid acyltransferase (LPLAT)-like uncharacterized protein
MSAPRRRWRDRRRRLELVLAPPLISAVLQLLALTVRVRLVGFDALLDPWRRGERVILAFWHDRALLMPLQVRGQPVCIMNSQSHDGEIVSRTVARWGIRSVRGSATRGGLRGFLQLVDAFRKGENLVLAPDGPRGPRHEAKPGVIHLGKATGAPIVPVSYAAHRCVRLGSWDRLIVPLPFSRVTFVVEEPVVVPRDAGAERIEELRHELERRLERAGAAAEASLAG